MIAAAVILLVVFACLYYDHLSFRRSWTDEANKAERER